MNDFKSYHPIVNFIYFLFVILFSMILMHPVCLLISFFCSFLYVLSVGKKGSLKSKAFFGVFVLLFSAALNMLFNNRGFTILCYLPGGNPLTLESAMYGLGAGLMLLSVINWFSCISAVLTSDKFMYLFGRIIPSLSLVFSVTLRFVPRFISQFKEVLNAQKSVGRGVESGKIKERFKNAATAVSVTVTWALENSVNTAESMKCRGYGLKNRTAFSKYRFSGRDFKMLIWVLFLGLFVLFGIILKKMNFLYFPTFKWVQINPLNLSFFAGYFLLCILPAALETGGRIKWKVLKSKI